MTNRFTITIEYDDKYEAADILESVMGNIDIENYEAIGVIFKIPHWLSVERKEYLKNKGLLKEDE